MGLNNSVGNHVPDFQSGGHEPEIRCNVGQQLNNVRKPVTYLSGHGATENAGVENAIRSKMQEWKSREKIAGVENAGVGKPYRKMNRYYTLKDP